MALTRVKGKVLQTSVDTIDDLPTTGYEGQVIEVLGYWAKGDGGGGTFRCSTTTGVGANHNGGTIFDPDVAAGTYTGGAGNIAWYRQYSGAVNVKWFGAGELQTASVNTLAINKAMEVAENKQLVFPYGSYTIDGELFVKSNCYIVGFGSTIYFTDNISSIRIHNASNIVVENLIVDAGADRGLAFDNNYYAIDVRESQNVEIRNCTVFNATAAGIIFNQAGGITGSDGNRDCSVVNCTVYNVGNSGLVGDYGNGIAVTNGYRINITGNTIYDCASPGAINLEGIGQDEITISNNLIHTLSGTAVGILLYAGGVDVDPKNIVITGNIISDCTTTGASIFIEAGDGVVVDSNIIADSTYGYIDVTTCTSIAITNNQLTNITNGGIYAHQAKYVRIIGNHIEFNTSATEVTYKNQMFLESYTLNTGSLIATGNTIVNAPAEAMVIAARSPVNVTNNVIIDCRKAVGVTKGFGVTYVAVDYNQSVIGGNTIVDNVGSASTRFFGFYNFEGAGGKNLIYNPCSFSDAFDTVPKYYFGTYNGYIKTTEALTGSVPSVGYHTKGDILWNPLAGELANIGLVCTATGEPGTWKPFGQIPLVVNGGTWDPPSIAAGGSVTQTFTATGAEQLDHVLFSTGHDLTGINASAWVSTTNTITVQYNNFTGSPIDLPSAGVWFKVISRE